MPGSLRKLKNAAASFKDDDYDRRLRLISLAYKVLQGMKVPDGATDLEMLSLMARRFSDMATAPLTPEAPPAKKPTSMFSRAQPASARHRARHFEPSDP
jgi:hypothetical protein